MTLEAIQFTRYNMKKNLQAQLYVFASPWFIILSNRNTFITLYPTTSSTPRHHYPSTSYDNLFPKNFFKTHPPLWKIPSQKIMYPNLFFLVYWLLLIVSFCLSIFILIFNFSSLIYLSLCISYVQKKKVYFLYIYVIHFWTCVPLCKKNIHQKKKNL